MHVNNRNHSISGCSALSNQTFDSLTVGGKASLDHVTCKNKLTCAGKVDVAFSTLRSVSVAGYAIFRQSTATDIVISGHLRAEDCASLGSIQASGQLHLVNSQVSQIQASGMLSLLQTKVLGDVKYKGPDLQMLDSRIEGKLTCHSKSTKINQSYVHEIVVRTARNFFGGNIFSCNFNIGFGSFKFLRHYSASSEQVVELNGPHCVVNAISFEEGTAGRVILKNGAKVIGPVLRGTVVEA